MAVRRALQKCTAASRRPELERRKMVRSSPIVTCASTASRSPRRFGDGAAKFDLCTEAAQWFCAAGALRELFELVAMLVGGMELLGVQHVYKGLRAALVACFLLF